MDDVEVVGCIVDVEVDGCMVDVEVDGCWVDVEVVDCMVDVGLGLTDVVDVVVGLVVVGGKEDEVVGEDEVRVVV